jgi:hypothetical protein
MIDYPLPPLRGGLYAQLGLSPEATAEEINEARQGYVFRLRTEQRAVQRELDAIYKAVPGLKEAIEELEALLGSHSDNAKDLRRAQSQVASLEKKAREIRGDIRSLRERAARLEKDIHEANVLAIQSQKDRLEYDQTHPPFEILKLEDCASSPLDDRTTLLWIIRTELTAFLEQAGESIAHPSDLSRHDFSHDFSFDSTLDQQK